ncbi:MAG TPA: DUF3052 family protein [Pyrinomonadaceae bacterium]|nr:DUF3052 family protein [Pyrinomonadaceae bacterium]
MENKKDQPTAGYSGTPLAKKLGFKAGLVINAIDAPDGILDFPGVTIGHLDSSSLGSLPQLEHRSSDIVHMFVNTRELLLRGLTEAMRLIKPSGAIWVSWYKRAAKLPTEITEDTIRDAALPLGLVDIKVCAVDENWSGLKLVIRRENRI